MKNIFAFGSVVRGEIDQYSDVDLLLITDKKIDHIDPNKYSIYTPQRIKEMFNEGNPFAWHLYYESKLIFTDDINYLKELGKPKNYSNCLVDLYKFRDLFLDSLNSLEEDDYSLIFDLSMIFLAIRNFATCYSLGMMNRPVFSRNSFERIGNQSLIIDEGVKKILMLARISSTRGINVYINNADLELVFLEVKKMKSWFNQLLIDYESGI